MPVWVITGANRGLGLEFVTQLSKDASNTIIATSRSMSRDSLRALEALDIKFKLHILECDTSSQSSIASFGKQVSLLLEDKKIDFLLNNAGINGRPDMTALTLTPEVLAEHVSVNVMGPAKTVQVLEGLLREGSVVLNMASGLASLTYNRTKDPTECTPYSISKAAVNMLTVHQANGLKKKGVIVISMDPGWVKTDMGGDKAVLEKEESIAGMVKCLKGLKTEDSGKFFGYDGEEIAW